MFKNIEIAFRRLLLRFLRLIVNRSKPLPQTIDFNNCKFLFVRQDRIGDVLISTPLIYALKSHYPKATVDFLLSENNHFVLENEPLVRKRWIYKKNLRGAVEVLFSIRNEHYDFVIDLMDNPSTTSTVICALAHGKWNVGLSKENEYAYDIPVPLLSRKETHIIDRLGMLLTVFGIDPNKETFRVRYLTSGESKQFARNFFDTMKWEGKHIIGINISPTDGVRFWGILNFQSLIKKLLAEHPNMPIVLLYAPSDKPQALEIGKPFSSVVLSPETHSFDQFAAIVEKVSLLVTPDTSVVHLAAAFQIPSVVLYVQSNKELRIWEPYGSDAETLVADVNDLKVISLESVFAAIQRMVEKIPPGGYSAQENPPPRL
ncbi:MAG: glycosyltransferase family 9 protein [Ignavibacteriales bacterium]|nr:glycosyltransferase family 9 protein [Ignavibacteriales bacterium]